MQLYCYYEKKASMVGTVVPEASACLDNAKNRGIDADHIGMNKFGRGDKRYEDTVKPDLLELIKMPSSSPQRDFRPTSMAVRGANPELLRLNQLLAPLTSSQQDRRDFHYREQQRTVGPKATCTWIHNMKLFNDWKMAGSFSCLWIHGKPGAGKRCACRIHHQVLAAR